MIVEAEFRELNIGSAFQKTSIIKSSKVFNKVAKKVSTSVGLTIGIPKPVELGIKTTVTHSIDETSQVEGTFEKHDEKSVTYQDGWLQIFRYVTKTIMIDGNTAEIQNGEHVETVPTHEHENDTQLLERARAYIQRKYGHEQYNGTANIVGEGNIYKINGQKGPLNEPYACQLVTDGETETEVDLDQLGGLRKATTRYEDNSLIIDLENPTTNQVDVITNHYIDPSEPNVMIYTLTDVDSGTKLVQHMNRQL